MEALALERCFSRTSPPSTPLQCPSLYSINYTNYNWYLVCTSEWSPGDIFDGDLAPTARREKTVAHKKPFGLQEGPNSHIPALGPWWCYVVCAILI